MKYGGFIISLDFELHWGAVENWDLAVKGKCFDQTRNTIPLILDLFNKYEVHATWATVGFLFAKNKQQLLEFCPKLKPTYTNKDLYYYKLIENNEIGEDETDDPYHFAPSIIKKIIETPHQELASHTFTHYYCNELGQTVEQFSEDLRAAQNLAKANFNIELRSLVFPRNQFNKNYIEAAGKNGFKVVRSNPDVWFWKEKFLKYSSIFRAIDTLLPISSSLTFTHSEEQNNVLLSPASRFFRPFSAKEKSIQKLKARRVKSEMLYAAKNGEYYHLWWHPCNFGDFPEENLAYLEDILCYYNELKTNYGFSSKTMFEMSKEDNSN